MIGKPKVVGLGGSLRQGSRSLMALRIAMLGAAEVETELIDLAASRFPLYQPGIPLSEYPAEVFSMLQSIREADALIWSAPAYHGTVSGSLKNALDYLEFLHDDEPPYLTGKVVGLISTAGGVVAAVNGLNALTHVAFALRAWVLPLTIPTTHASWRPDEHGYPTDRELLERLLLLGRQLAACAVRRSVSSVPDSSVPDRGVRPSTLWEPERPASNDRRLKRSSSRSVPVSPC